MNGACHQHSLRGKTEHIELYTHTKCILLDFSKHVELLKGGFGFFQKNNTFITHCILPETLRIYYHSQSRIPPVPVSKPSKSPALIPIFLPKTSIRRIALLLLLPLGANLFLQRWKLSVPTKLLTHSQWRCQFSRPRHCGLDNLIGEARRCVPGRAFKCCITPCPSAGSSPAVEIQDSAPFLLQSRASPPHAGGGRGAGSDAGPGP